MKKMLRKLLDWLYDQSVDFTERIFVLLTIIAEVGVLIALIGDISYQEDAVEIAVLAATEVLV
ncbi:MAG: hypothetical protein J5449_08740, partial [Oscillospiraceae bacterium]|nr:hypothetical protein [Oscillospiraceae bacterium]